MTDIISYNLSNPIRDVSPDFNALIAESPSFLKLLGGLSQSLDVITGRPIVTNTKHEWIDLIMTATKTTITSFVTDGDGTVFNVASSSGFAVGSVVGFESSLGASKTELAIITAINSSTQITITRDYGSTTGVTLAVGDVVFLVSTPRAEKSSLVSGNNISGTAAYNYTQIFDEVVSISSTSLSSATYDRESQLRMQMRYKMIQLARQIEMSVIKGAPVARSASNNGTLGGLNYFLTQSGGNIDATGGSISTTIINNLIEDMIANGGDVSNLAILAAPNQCRKISALNYSGSNPQNFKDVNDTKLYSGYTTAFVGDIPVDGKGAFAQVFMCQSMYKDKLMVLDMNRIMLAVMRGLTAELYPKTNDGEDWRLLTELTLEVRNATKAHGIATGLDL